MMESSAKASTKYLEELSILLRSQGFIVHPRETRDIDVEHDGSTLCRINDLGNLGYFADKIAGKESVLDRIRETARSAREYMTLLEQAPPLAAEGLSEEYQLLAEFNGTVLAGHMTRYGAQFVTWEWVHNKTALWQGHYYGVGDSGGYSSAKGDLARNYGAIAIKHYGYKVAVIDLRNPTRSDGYNLLTLINHYMDVSREDPGNLAARAKAEKYAKILAKTIVNPEGDASSYGQNAFFYDSAEGLLTAVVLLLAEYLPPKNAGDTEKRHIVSVFKLVQDLLGPSRVKGKNGFQYLMDALPETHKARWFAGAALNSADQAMASVMSTVLSRLNAFLDSELEQVLCFDSAIDAETFASQKSAIFLVLPEEDPSKNFMAGLMIQTLSRELFSVADEHEGKLPNRVVLFCDELGTMPAFDILPLFSAGRSRKLTLVPIIQSLAQLEKNYGKEGAEIIQDNVQDTIFGGFAPNSQTAEVLSKAMGSRTALSGYISTGKDKSQTLQMTERPLMTPDELKSIPKGQFVVMKTGSHPMRTRLRLFLDWGITFGEPNVIKLTNKFQKKEKKPLTKAKKCAARP